jgi:hypothetical protein
VPRREILRADGTLWPGLSRAIIFGIEFVLIYRGLL